VFAPFGTTDGFDLSPEERRKRKQQDEERQRDERREKGVEKDF
jgi:hypothetical protein